MFLYRLGRDLGFWNIDLLSVQMSPGQRQEWLAFYNIERRHQEREMLQADVETRLKSRAKR